MVRLREIQRTAAFAWSPGSGSPAIVTGTKAGAVDADFSNDTTLELWDLGLDSVKPVTELQPAGSINTDSRFHDIAWSRPTSDKESGVIAGALESGALELWDATKLRTSPTNSHLSSTVKHSGAAKALQFNHFRNELLATAGAKGELFIWDLNNIANPFKLGASAARADDYECLDWNKGEKVPHILATGSSGGFVTVWDVRGKKENLTLNNQGRKAVSAVSWDPSAATRLITAVPNDQDPVILVWDLRNSNAPEKVLKGHELGVLSLDWCAADSDLLLSCGKDNRTICWDPHTGQAYGEYPVVTNWTFQTRWNPHNPDIFATASFDGKIAIQSIQNTNSKANAETTTAPVTDGEDFFAQTQARPQGPSFSLSKTPKWQKRSVAASFGFGGKLLCLGLDASGKSRIKLDTFAVDSSIPQSAKSFEDALTAGDISSFCEKKASEATDEEEKADWQVIGTLSAGTSRQKISAYLGLKEGGVDGVQDPDKGAGQAQVNGIADDGDFFNGDSADSDNFLGNLASTKGTKTNEPFSLHGETESGADKDITAALVLGNYDRALDICLADKRLSDAFMIAICGGQKCIDKVQRAYLKEKSNGPSYLRLLASIVGKNLWDVVHNADLAHWKEVMATLCTYADGNEFSDLCEALGDRLEESIAAGNESTTFRRDASFCYLAGSKLEKVIKIWTQELQEREINGLKSDEGGSGFSIHARSLQDFIEKVTVFRQVTKFQDSGTSQNEEWKLASLYAKYTEYADILAAHGELVIAQKYLDLLPTKYPLADVAQQRVRKATARAPLQPAARQPTATAARTAPRPPVPGYPGATASASGPGLPYGPGSATTSVQPSGPYAPSVSASQPTGPYAPVGGYAPQTGYQPPGPTPYQPPTQPSGFPGASSYGGYQPPQSSLAPPPRSSSTSNGPPASKGLGSDAPNWNDTPDNFFKAPSTSRRGTPGLGPALVSSPFPNATPYNNAAPGGPPGATPGFPPAKIPLPPPPKVGESTPKVMSPVTSQLPVRPPSAAANAYAPPASSTPASGPFPGVPAAPPALRGPSPYNQPPPSAGPPSNRYAPAPSAQPSTPAAAPQAVRNAAPPPNPYARAPSNYAARPGGHPTPGGPPPPGPTSAAPPPTTGPPPMSRPPTSGPPPGPPRATGGPPRQDTPTTVPPATQGAPSAAAAKHPPGDRSHIPPEAQPIFEILSADMARVKARAPATFAPQVNDTEKRLAILFDHLNNSDLIKPDTVQELVEISRSLQLRDTTRAQEILTEMIKTKQSEGGNWIVGVKRLIAMSRATPV